MLYNIYCSLLNECVKLLIVKTGKEIQLLKVAIPSFSINRIESFSVFVTLNCVKDLDMTNKLKRIFAIMR
jgi:hypothetical protein